MKTNTCNTNNPYIMYIGIIIKLVIMVISSVVCVRRQRMQRVLITISCYLYIMHASWLYLRVSYSLYPIYTKAHIFISMIIYVLINKPDKNDKVDVCD